jgi:hypothetical protein
MKIQFVEPCTIQYTDMYNEYIIRTFKTGDTLECEEFTDNPHNPNVKPGKDGLTALILPPHEQDGYGDHFVIPNMSFIVLEADKKT